ncbi:Phosphorylated carbohydrates phosphatase [bioreactor metagenome]|uniref:Phosphorylated carbohydrates phosphatase n=1 Tax=bioreactor metagenome TaxID=1076179 RepID=A0A645BRR6_9ZZZZ
MIQAVIFDMDGLMFDTERIGLKVWQEIAQEWHQPRLNDLIWQCLGTNDSFRSNLFANEFDETFDYDLFCETEMSRRIERTLQSVPTKEGLYELLDYLKKHAIKMAVATSSSMETAEKILKAAKVFDYFDVIVTGNMVEHSKPSPDIFLLACKKLDANITLTLGLEDSINGIRALHSAGIRAVMIPDLVQPDEETGRLYYKKLDNLSQVIEIIDGENL